MLYVIYDPHNEKPTYDDTNYMSGMDALFEKCSDIINEGTTSDLGFIELNISSPVHLAYLVQNAIAGILSKKINENRIIVNFLDDDKKKVTKIIGSFRTLL